MAATDALLAHILEVVETLIPQRQAEQELLNSLAAYMRELEGLPKPAKGKARANKDPTEKKEERKAKKDPAL
jgi:hypothetical protein